MITARELQDKHDFLARAAKGTLIDHLGIEFVKLLPDEVVARMLVKPIHHQPFGILHGGVSVALAESVASIGAWLNLAEGAGKPVGIEINANHISAFKEGTIRACAEPLHRGRTTHVWSVSIRDEDTQKLICVSRCTVAIVSDR